MHSTPDALDEDVECGGNPPGPGDGKDLDLAMDAGIRLDVRIFDERVAQLVAEHGDLITEETRAAELGEVTDGYEEEWEVEGVTMRFAIDPVRTTEV